MITRRDFTRISFGVRVFSRGLALSLVLIIPLADRRSRRRAFLKTAEGLRLSPQGGIREGRLASAPFARTTFRNQRI
jgi:hypothetical protein